MAARFARFAARGITSSVKNNSRLCSREVARIPGERACLARHHSRVVSSLQVIQPQSTNLVQIASRKFGQHAPIINCDVTAKISSITGGLSETMEESAGECEDEATNGRKRIKLHELYIDDP